MIAAVLALACWTLVMWAWMYVTRIPAMQAAKIDPQSVADKPKALAELLPPQVSRIANNYNHLHEQPTVFYAVALALVVGGLADGLAVTLAWAYVGLRVAHSLVQATINITVVRFLVFVAGSLVLAAMAVRGLLAAI
jgi:hypothetical protein